jgi:hypothetical protein
MLTAEIEEIHSNLSQMRGTNEASSVVVKEPDRYVPAGENPL